MGWPSEVTFELGLKYESEPVMGIAEPVCLKVPGLEEI